MGSKNQSLVVYYDPKTENFSEAIKEARCSLKSVRITIIAMPRCYPKRQAELKKKGIVRGENGE